jgi:DNA helicase-2/ATP-dependent DNA helicase PcrA
VRPVIPSPFLNELPLEEMRRVESNVQRDWFDDDIYDDSYPESWDLPDESADQSSDFAPPPDDDICQLPDQERAKKTNESRAGFAAVSQLKTGADLLSGQKTPVTAYREGTVVRHHQYGEGTVVSVSGRGPKRTARVIFPDGEHQFRLAFAKLEVLE